MDFDIGSDFESEPETAACPKCGYESAPVYPAPFQFEGDDPNMRMVAIIPVTDCPICNEKTPIQDPEACRKEAIEIQQKARQRMMESVMRDDKAIKAFYTHNAFSLFMAGIMIGYAALSVMECLKNIGKPALWIDVFFAVLCGLIGGVLTYGGARQMRKHNNSLIIMAHPLDPPTSENTK